MPSFMRRTAKKAATVARAALKRLWGSGDKPKRKKKRGGGGSGC